MNFVAITGNLARDPEMRVLQNNSVVANLVVAVSRFFVRQDGTHDKETAFVPCEIWDTAAKYIGENLKKGDFIIISDASIKENRWEDAEGNKKSRLVLRINKFERGPKRTQPQQQEQENEPANDTENVPF